MTVRAHTAAYLRIQCATRVRVRVIVRVTVAVAAIVSLSLIQCVIPTILI